jgi:hypothetical protein
VDLSPHRRPRLALHLCLAVRRHGRGQSLPKKIRLA